MNEFEVQSPKSKDDETSGNFRGAADSLIIDGELLNDDAANQKTEIQELKTEIRGQETNVKRQNLQYIFLPVIFLFVALLGGLRLDAADSSFLFLKPALLCLVYASALIFLFFRARLVKLDGWFNEKFSGLKNTANAGVLLALFFASAQIFNSLLPERGAAFYVVAFCFFWTLWNNMFSEFDARRLIKSLAGMFALAFFVKYLILANLAAPPSDSFWQRITENPTKEAFTYLLDLPRFARATGYVQFFALAFYLLGLFLLKPETED